MATSNEWQPADTAPQDGSHFIGLFDWPMPVAISCYSKPDNKWCIANVAADMYQGEWEYFFENEYLQPGELLGWQPLPEASPQVLKSAKERRTASCQQD